MTTITATGSTLKSYPELTIRSLRPVVPVREPT